MLPNGKEIILGDSEEERVSVAKEVKDRLIYLVSGKQVIEYLMKQDHQDLLEDYLNELSRRGSQAYSSFYAL